MGLAASFESHSAAIRVLYDDATLELDMATYSNLSDKDITVLVTNRQDGFPFTWEHAFKAKSAGSYPVPPGFFVTETEEGISLGEMTVRFKQED